LCNISMHDLNILLDFVRENQRISVSFSLRENNSFSISSVTN
jgi:hypothetical protein